MNGQIQQHLSTARVNEALDGVLAASEMDEIERHVGRCATCRDEYARLSEIVQAVRALPRTSTPPEHAWDNIASRIAAPDFERDSADETPVIELGRARTELGRARTEREREGRGGGGREGTTGQRIGAGIYLSLTQLAAAAAIVAVVSATLVWVGMNGGSAVPASIASTQPASGGAAARAVSLETGRYAEAVTALEAIIEEGRGVLDPQTLFTIEESLRAVDEAIADVEQALGDDPNSALLLRLLANQQRTKLGVLQRAADAVHAQT